MIRNIIDAIKIKIELNRIETVLCNVWLLHIFKRKVEKKRSMIWMSSQTERQLQKTLNDTLQHERIYKSWPGGSDWVMLQQERNYMCLDAEQEVGQVSGTTVNRRFLEKERLETHRRLETLHKGNSWSSQTQRVDWIQIRSFLVQLSCIVCSCTYRWPASDSYQWVIKRLITNKTDRLHSST